MRIIGGTHRRRSIEFPDVQDLRPTPDRVRETVFNWLGQSLDGRRCLDLFAGSGALGFEAASRGAVEVVMVESNRIAFHALQNNKRKLALENIALRCEDSINFVRQVECEDCYDVIFLDPPFQSGYLPELLTLLPYKLSKSGMVYVESGAAFEPNAAWQVSRRAKAGRVHFQLLQHVSLATGQIADD